MQSGFHLGQLVDLALHLHTAKVRGQALRHLVLAVRHLIRGGTGHLSLNLLGGLNLRAQFQPAVGQQIAYFRQSDFVWRDLWSAGSIEHSLMGSPRSMVGLRPARPIGELPSLASAPCAIVLLIARTAAFRPHSKPPHEPRWIPVTNAQSPACSASIQPRFVGPVNDHRAPRRLAQRESSGGRFEAQRRRLRRPARPLAGHRIDDNQVAS